MAYTNITKGQPDWDTTINNNFQQVQTDLATDETLTTVHNLTLQSGFAGTAKLITYMLGGVARVALRIAVSPSTAQTLDATVPIVVAPDITSDPAAIAGGRKNVNWMYTPAKVWQIQDANLLFAFHDGYGYINQGMTAALQTSYLLMVDMDTILV